MNATHLKLGRKLYRKSNGIGNGIGIGIIYMVRRDKHGEAHEQRMGTVKGHRVLS